MAHRVLRFSTLPSKGLNCSSSKAHKKLQPRSFVPPATAKRLDERRRRE